MTGAAVKMERYALTVRVAPQALPKLGPHVREISSILEGYGGMTAPDCSYAFEGGAMIQIIADFPSWAEAQAAALGLSTQGLGMVEVEPVTPLDQFVPQVVDRVYSQGIKTS